MSKIALLVNMKSRHEFPSLSLTSLSCSPGRDVKSYLPKGRAGNTSAPCPNVHITLVCWWKKAVDCAATPISCGMQNQPHVNDVNGIHLGMEEPCRSTSTKTNHINIGPFASYMADSVSWEAWLVLNGAAKAVDPGPDSPPMAPSGHHRMPTESMISNRKVNKAVMNSPRQDCNDV